MEAREAVRTAKAYLGELYADETIENVGLEEVKRDGDFWLITLGFSRPWERTIDSVLNPPKVLRSYKVLEIADPDGEVISMTDRLQPAAP